MGEKRQKKTTFAFSEMLAECVLGTSENRKLYLVKVSNRSVPEVFHFLSDTLNTEIDDTTLCLKDCCIVVSI